MFDEASSGDSVQTVVVNRQRETETVQRSIMRLRGGVGRRGGSEEQVC